jgi:hypothetical protein
MSGFGGKRGRGATVSTTRAILAIILGLVLATSGARGQTKIPAPADDEAYQRLTEQMRTSFSAEIPDATPLIDALMTLRQATGFQFRLDQRALSDAAISEDVEVEFRVADLQLSDFLAGLLEPVDLTWVSRHGVILITTVEVAEEHLITRVYPVADLVIQKRGDTLEADFTPLTNLIMGAVESNSWMEVGGTGEIHGLSSAGALVCSQTWQVHQKVEALLGKLRVTRGQQDVDWSLVRPPPACLPKSGGPSPAISHAPPGGLF